MFDQYQLGTFEQLIRLVLTWIGTFTLGAGVTTGAQFESAVGGVIAIASFVWWLIRNRTVKKNYTGL